MIVKEGYLSKWTNVMKGWQHRWLVLDDNAGMLSYYVSRDKMKKGLRRGCIPLKRAVVGIDNEDEPNFTVTSQLKIYHFQAKNITERNDWVSSIEDTILRHAYGTSRKPLCFEQLLKPDSSIEDFNKKLHEADSYLQMVIEHTKAVSKKMDTLQETKNRAMCSILTTYANNLLDDVKHTIILLQIAKSTMYPNNSAQIELETNDSVQGTEATDVEVFPNEMKTASQISVKAAYSTSDDENFFDARETLSRSSSPSIISEEEVGSSQHEDDGDKDDDKICMLGKLRNSNPEYLSDKPSQSNTEQSPGSQSEEESYPQDIIVAVGKPCMSKASRKARSTGKVNTSCASNSSARPEIRSADGTINYDYIYENSEESEIAIECSVVSHLISQVKIGMDLSKVALPIFILEKRSLLEMYADFFAHPDEFVGITDQLDAKGRMVQLVKWYLSSFHAARKGDVAKKPYNPILGEVFLCSWDLGVESENDDLKEGAPVSGYKLSFAAEQVSHHPPISAFYAECPSKGITCSSYIWTRSKFYGLSIGVINHGEALVNVVKYDEQYTLTFPNVYGRSILTKPWLELGGNVRITCEKTGYAASIEFLTKPFYGTKRHKIVGAILEPGATKPFVTLEGEWTGKIYARWLNGEAEVFSDINEMPIFKKYVRSVNEQDGFESRKIWKDVTAGLWLNDISRATNAKIEIESRQRREAQARSENGETWNPRLFVPTSSGKWDFKRPLRQ